MDRIKYWSDLAEEDISVAEILHRNGKILYSGFMCHLAVEKILKAKIESCGETPSKIHNLNKLAELGKVLELMTEEQTGLLDTLNPLQLEARYPAYKQQIESMLSAEQCKKLIQQSKEMILWIKTLL